MVIRIHVEDEKAAQAAAEALAEQQHEVALLRERFAGEDDDEAVELVVATTAPRAEVARLFPDAFITED